MKQTHLTPRQWDIALLIADGLSNKAIGRELGITEATVKIQLRQIFQKHNIRKRTRLAVMVVLWKREEEQRLALAAE